DTNQAWWASAVSNDGAIMLAADYGGRIYRSTDTGDTWTEVQPAGNSDKYWGTADVSRGGQNMLAGNNTINASEGRLYRSTDGGDTWNEVQPAGDADKSWRLSVQSNNGQVMLAAVNGERIYRSTDTGDTWTEVQPAGNSNKVWW